MIKHPENTNPSEIGPDPESADTPTQEHHGIEQELARYLSLGWYLVPMKPKGKTPLIKKWQEAASNDMDVIRGWRKKWPDANFAVATGRSGLAIPDIDGAEGQALFDTVMDGSPMPATPVAKTDRGAHLYMTDPGGGDFTRWVVAHARSPVLVVKSD